MIVSFCLLRFSRLRADLAGVHHTDLLLTGEARGSESTGARPATVLRDLEAVVAGTGKTVTFSLQQQHYLGLA